MINLYEILKEATMKMTDEELTLLLSHHDILAYLYELWMKKFDNLYDEMECHVTEELKKLISKTRRGSERTAA